jgi:hypothetical protein
MEIGRKLSGDREAGLSGCNRRSAGDQLGGQSGTDRSAPPVRRSIHSFHIPILRSMNGLNNGTYGPTVDHRPERGQIDRCPLY